MTNAIDLDQFEGALERQEKGIEVSLLSMDGKSPLGVSIRVAGPDSERAAKARADLHQELVDNQNVDPLSPAEAAARGVRFLAKITLARLFGGQRHSCL
jgi:hypothetical protein